MNRRIKWSQNPPNFADYDPGCVTEPSFAPFQQSARPVEDAGAAKVENNTGRRTAVAAAATPGP